ncbi:MAG: hydrogenase small subunit [Anaerolineae bacterium]|nr:hydrogenase small subunit [Anaerolineae bacterium]
MNIKRRDFLKLSLAAAAALKLKLDVDQLEVALASDADPPLIWLQGAGCTGCTMSTLNVVEPTVIDDVLLNKVSMKFNSTVMSSAGGPAMQALAQAASEYTGQFILVVEGAVPTAADGLYCVVGEDNGALVTIEDAVLKYGPMAKYVVAAGTCAAFGGVAAAEPNTTGSSSVKAVLDNKTLNPVINLPGCPVHPTVMIQSLVDLLLIGMPSLDYYNRPLLYYSNNVHSSCPRRGTGAATAPGEVGCYRRAGCKGQSTENVCTQMMWNNGENVCMLSNYPCIGCADPAFPTNPLTC